jgi:hypothetical protein
MTRLLAAVLALVTLLVASACKDDPTPPAAASASASASAGPRPSAAGSRSDPAEAYRDDDLPVAPDFEANAEKDITAENYKQKLAEIESALGTTRDAGSDAAAPVDD